MANIALILLLVIYGIVLKKFYDARKEIVALDDGNKPKQHIRLEAKKVLRSAINGFVPFFCFMAFRQAALTACLQHGVNVPLTHCIILVAGVLSIWVILKLRLQRPKAP